MESCEEKIVGVNSYASDDDSLDVTPYRPDPVQMQQHVDQFLAFKAERSEREVKRALDDLARAANSESDNIFASVVAGAESGCTHGEIVAVLRQELGFGHPLVVT